MVHLATQRGRARQHGVRTALSPPIHPNAPQTLGVEVGERTFTVLRSSFCSTNWKYGRRHSMPMNWFIRLFTAFIARRSRRDSTGNSPSAPMSRNCATHHATHQGDSVSALLGQRGRQED